MNQEPEVPLLPDSHPLWIALRNWATDSHRFGLYAQTDTFFRSCKTIREFASSVAKKHAEELTKRLAIAEAKNQGTLANNLCPDHRDKQVGKPCLACEIETLERKQLASVHRQTVDDLSFSVMEARAKKYEELIMDIADDSAFILSQNPGANSIIDRVLEIRTEVRKRRGT